MKLIKQINIDLQEQLLETLHVYSYNENDHNAIRDMHELVIEKYGFEKDSDYEFHNRNIKIKLTQQLPFKSFVNII